MVWALSCGASQGKVICHLQYLHAADPGFSISDVISTPFIHFFYFMSCLLVFTQVTSPSWYLPSSWRAACLCGWARSVSTASETPSAPTLSWSSALKDWVLKLSYSRWVLHTERENHEWRTWNLIRDLIILCGCVLGPWCEPVVCAELCGDSRGTASPRPHALLLQAV